MATLHALFVGIDAYPGPGNSLNGCLNDLKEIRTFMESHCRQAGLTFRPRVLTDADATRAAIIAGFDHFDAAVDGDSCLFFYAGHGGQCEAPEAFWHLEPDRRLESLVCWDSRQKDGRDLMDKELSYLLWRATKDKAVHFLVITDCCHSGNITRWDDVGEISVRQMGKTGAKIPVEEFLGIDTYLDVGEGRYSPPQGRYVHLAAARDRETAKEVYIQGKARGVFTVSLMETLTQTGGFLTYGELIGRVNLCIRQQISDQSPQIQTWEAEDKNRYFLSDKKAPEGPQLLVSYHSSLGWIVNAGTLHGVSTGDKDIRTTLDLTEDGHQINVTESLADCSKVSGMDAYDPYQVYPARMVRFARPKFNLVFAPGSEAKGMKTLAEELERQDSNFFRLAVEVGNSGYWVHAKNNGFWLTRPFDNQALFKKVEGYDEAASVRFLNALEKVANWQRILELSNPGSSIRGEEIRLELYRVTDPGNYNDNAPVEATDWQGSPAFPYMLYKGEWHKPAFQLKVKNTGLRPLWISLLYLGDDFSITNALIPKQNLEPGEEVWALDIFEGYPYRTIPLQMEDHYYEQDITAIDEYLKLFICTEEFETTIFNQKGLKGEELIMRSHGRRSQPEQRDWTAREVHLRIERPMD